MRNILLSILLLSPNTLLAYAKHESLYEAIDQAEEQLSYTSARVIYTKFVGGLSCKRTIDIQTGEQFDCEYDPLTENEAQSLYSVLNVATLVISSGLTHVLYRKQAGNLACYLLAHQVHNDQFYCKLE